MSTKDTKSGANAPNQPPKSEPKASSTTAKSSTTEAISANQYVQMKQNGITKTHMIKLAGKTLTRNAIKMYGKEKLTVREWQKVEGGK